MQLSRMKAAVTELLLTCFILAQEASASPHFTIQPLTQKPSTENPREELCPSGFHSVGGRCVLVEPFTSSSWVEARYLCQTLGGDLVVLDSMNFYAELLSYIHSLFLNTHDYWVGANDDGAEGYWKWVDNSDVWEGTPLWAISRNSSYDDYEQEPEYSGKDCGFMDLSSYYYLNDDYCQSLKPCICQAPHSASPVTAINTKTSTIENHNTKPEESSAYFAKTAIDVPNIDITVIENPIPGAPIKFIENPIPKASIYRPDKANTPSGETDNDANRTNVTPTLTCTGAFEVVEGKCVLVDPFTDSTWYEARYLCERLGGSLVKLDSMDFYAQLLQYIQENGLANHKYWVGANDESYEGLWRWLDSSSVLMGTPLWALRQVDRHDHYHQEPTGGPDENCGYLDDERFHYLDDTGCSAIMACICEAPGMSS